MNTDKRSFYVWMIVVLANVSVYLSAAISVIRDGNSIIDGLLSPITQHFLIAIVCIFISVVPAWLSGSNLKFRNRLGYIGVPILLLLPVPYLVWMANHCTGKFCGLGYMAGIYGLGLAAIISILFYLMGTYFRRWNKNVSLFFVWTGSVFVICAITFLFYSAYSNNSLTALKNGETMNLTKTAELCNSFRDRSYGSGQRAECWTTAIKANPGVDVCSLANSEDSKNMCLASMGFIYTENSCSSGLVYGNYLNSDDPNLYGKLTKCWQDASKIYPGLDICADPWTYDMYDATKKCRAALSSIPQ